MPRARGRSFSRRPSSGRIRGPFKAALARFYEAKSQPDVPNLHRPHPRPVHPGLPAADIDAVDIVARRDADAKLPVFLVMYRVLDHRGHVVTHRWADNASQNDEKSRKKQLPLADHPAERCSAEV